MLYVLNLAIAYIWGDDIFNLQDRQRLHGSTQVTSSTNTKVKRPQRNGNLGKGVNRK